MLPPRGRFCLGTARRQKNLSLANQPFAIHKDYKGFKALFDWWDKTHPLPTGGASRLHRLGAIEIEVSSGFWESGPDGQVELRPMEDDEDAISGGLFFNLDGGFTLNCPCCGDRIILGEDEDKDAAVSDALNTWCVSPESARLRCCACNEERPLQDWRADDQSFAAGHLAITFWDAHLLQFVEAPDLEVCRFFRELVGGTTDPDPAVAFRHI